MKAGLKRVGSSNITKTKTMAGEEYENEGQVYVFDKNLKMARRETGHSFKTKTQQA